MIEDRSNDRPFYRDVSRLLLQNQSFGRFDEDDENQLNSSIDTDLANTITLEMRKSLVSNNDCPALLDKGNFSDTRITVSSKDEIESLFTRSTLASSYAIVRLMPGFSKDTRSAVLCLTFGPTAHGASATFFLVRGSDGWKVKWHRYTRYA
jgi:hypothetical protein